MAVALRFTCDAGDCPAHLGIALDAGDEWDWAPLADLDGWVDSRFKLEPGWAIVDGKVLCPVHSGHEKG